MWVYLAQFLLSLPITMGNHPVETDKSMLQHYMNHFKMGENFLKATFDMDSEGYFFHANEGNKRAEFGYAKNTVFMILPMTTNRSIPVMYHRRIAIDLESIGKKGRVHLTIVFEWSNIFVYDGCDEIFSDYYSDMWFEGIELPIIQFGSPWSGPPMEMLKIGTGLPIGLECKNTVKKKYAEFYVEKVELFDKQHMKRSNEIDVAYFFEQAGTPPLDFDGCVVNDVLIPLGETREADCNSCTCLGRDDLVCHAIDCPAVTCHHPMIREGDCCPTCGQQCMFDHHQIANAHGEIFWPGDCHKCQCWDGKVTCETIPIKTCPPPPCPKEDWIYGARYNCCPKCRDNAKFCSMKPCDQYADCTDVKRGPKCVCGTGFSGNGTFCYDIDECQFSADVVAQLGGCLSGSSCVNTMGSYRCDCLPGFTSLGEGACVPLLRV